MKTKKKQTKRELAPEFLALKNKLQSRRPNLWRDWSDFPDFFETLATPFFEKEKAIDCRAEALGVVGGIGKLFDVRIVECNGLYSVCVGFYKKNKK